MSNLPSKIPRNLLSEVFNNNLRMVKAFEEVLTQINDAIPTSLDVINQDLITIQTNITAINASIASILSNITIINNDIATLQTNLSNLIASLGTMAYQDASNVAITGGSAIIDLLTVHNANFINTNVNLNNYAGANIATFTNSPIAGNPSKWIVINDNGTNRYLPLF